MLNIHLLMKKQVLEKGIFRVDAENTCGGRDDAGDPA